MDLKERLEKAKILIDDMTYVTRAGSGDIEILDWLIEQAEKVERYEKALKRIVQQTHCDDTWDFANRVLEGKPNNDLFYRMNID